MLHDDAGLAPAFVFHRLGHRSVGRLCSAAVRQTLHAGVHACRLQGGPTQNPSPRTRKEKRRPMAGVLDAALALT